MNWSCVCASWPSGSEALRARDTYWKIPESDCRPNDIIIQQLDFPTDLVLVGSETDFSPVKLSPCGILINIIQFSLSLSHRADVLVSGLR